MATNFRIRRRTQFHRGIPKLRSLRLQNFRSYVDTGEIDLTGINIFIGPNNAGKSGLLSAVELFLRSNSTGIATHGPLALDQMPSFSAFDSVLRRHWSNKEARAQEFALGYKWGPVDEEPLQMTFTCRGRANDSAAYVSEASYSHEKVTLKIHPSEQGTVASPAFDVHGLTRTAQRSVMVAFRGSIPLFFAAASLRQAPFADVASEWLTPLEVVRPFRPIPRSLYVLDDPGLTTEERHLISFLLNIWGSLEPGTQAVRERIVSSLKTLGLVNHIDVHPLGQKTGPKVVEIKVAPSKKRHSVTIADVGFGISQVLPLAVADARLENGALLAYQPEVHLHPRAQSRLADLFVSSAARGNQVFVETHSPDLILRIQALVARGVIRDSEVAIFCMGNPSGETSITRVDLRPGGVPAVPWPDGFLDTSLVLARDLARARVEATK